MSQKFSGLTRTHTQFISRRDTNNGPVEYYTAATPTRCPTARTKMGRQTRASRVYQTFTQEMANRVMPQYRVQEPPWYKVLGAIPPSELFTRPIPVQHAPPNPRAKKPRNIYKPQKLVYEEDALRTRFYKDHPWELARPRIVLELDGMDALRCDWSKGLRQPGIALSGEW